MLIYSACAKEEFVSRICDVCGKKPSFGFNISHSHHKTKRRWNPNIQKVRVTENGTTERKNVCTKCLKANKVTRA